MSHEEQKPKARGFSGKSALMRDRREERLAVIDSVRCSVCRIPLTDDVKISWCPVADCPKTDKQAPDAADLRRIGG